MQQSEQGKNTDIRFFSRTADAWDAMYRDCENAKESIEFEQYILMDDPAGHRFLELFAQKAEDGVDVRLMLDGIGSRNLVQSPATEKIRAAGGKVYFYNRIGLSNAFRPSHWFPRNHNKTLLIDGRIGYIGSVCLWNIMKDWRDLHARFTGKLVQDVRQNFNRMWRMAARNVRIPAPRVKQGNGLFRYITTQHWRRPNMLYHELLKHIKKAKSRIWIATPYFLPPWRLRRALRKATRRGVDIRILMSAESDVPLADYVARSFYPRFLRNDMAIFHYKESVLHAKYVLIDEDWATIGSSNMDYLSLTLNREANIIIHEPATVADMAAHFEQDCAISQKIDLTYYKQMPLYQKIIGMFGRMIRRIL